jgi:hypothetical protein
MSFPFTVTYSSRLSISMTDANKTLVLACIQDMLLKKSAKTVTVGTYEVGFKGSTSPWRGSLMGSVDKGIFTLIEKDGISILTYKFYFIQLFIVTPLMGLCFGLFSKSVWIGVGAFLWLGGMNWVIAIVRHHSLFQEISEQLNNDLAT